LVAFLWSTSWVLIKIGLEDIPALTFAGLRYTLAFACLLPLAWRSGHRVTLRRLSRAEWGQLVALGLFMYAVAQGGQYLALDRLPAITISLLLNFTAVIVALLGIAMLAEVPTLAQWGGIAIYLIGVVAYFYPAAIPTGQVIGLSFALLCVLGTSLGTIIGRDVNRRETLSPLAITTVSMGIGALIMLAAGVAAQGLPTLSLQSWAIIAWLALVNTAFAFTLWNHTQRTLPAVESGVIANTMLIQIAILAWVFLGERLSPREIGGLALAAVGTLIVQLGRPRRPARRSIQDVRRFWSRG
jgi:drug/metabolite transporter (DMT)-like permease